MKKLRKITAIAATALLLSSCSLTMPVNATSNSVGSKVGTASAKGYLGVLFFNQDASIQAAAKAGGISKISTVDIETTNILNLIITYKTIVTGE